MRGRVPDNADTRLFLSKFLRAVDEANLPGHGATLLLHISAQPGGRTGYADAARACDLNEGQMERAVAALRAKHLIVVVKDDDDTRRKRLAITRDGERVVGQLITLE